MKLDAIMMYNYYDQMFLDWIYLVCVDKMLRPGSVVVHLKIIWYLKASPITPYVLLTLTILRAHQSAVHLNCQWNNFHRMMQTPCRATAVVFTKFRLQCKHQILANIVHSLAVSYFIENRHSITTRCTQTCFIGEFKKMIGLTQVHLLIIFILHPRKVMAV